jgi:BNR repeat protein/BNR/Asp-box repeat protein
MLPPHRRPSPPPRRVRTLLHLLAVLLVALPVAHLVLAGRAIQASRGDVTVPRNIRVSDDGFPAHSEPYVAVNPANPRNLLGASKMFTDPVHYQFRIGTYVSFDGGATWHDNGQLPGPAGYTITSDVTIAYDAHGAGYVAVLAVRSGGRNAQSGVLVYRTADGGRTFAPPVAVFHDAGFHNDKPWLAIDPQSGALDVAWVRITDRDRRGAVAFSCSFDHGHTFSPPHIISGLRDRFTQGPVISVGARGAVQVVYLDVARRLMEAVESTDGGATFGLPHHVAQVGKLPGTLPHATFRLASLPAASVDPRSGTLYVAWTDERGGHAVVVLAQSDDGGQTWSKPRPVALRSFDDTFMPAVAISSSGTVVVSYFARHLSATVQTIDGYLVRSTDRGSTFTAPQRITSKSWDPSLDAPVPDRDETFIGDYQGLVVDGSLAIPFWNDTRTGRQEIYTAAIPVDAPSASPFLL